MAQTHGQIQSRVSSFVQLRCLNLEQFSDENMFISYSVFGMYDWMAEEGFQYCSWDEPGVPPTCGYHTYQEGLLYLAHKAGAEVVSYMYSAQLRCLNLEQSSNNKFFLSVPINRWLDII